MDVFYGLVVNVFPQVGIENNLSGNDLNVINLDPLFISLISKIGGLGGETFISFSIKNCSLPTPTTTGT